MLSSRPLGLARSPHRVDESIRTVDVILVMDCDIPMDKYAVPSIRDSEGDLY